LFFPTVAAAVRLTRWMDLGGELQLAYGTFDLSNVSNVPLNNIICPGSEYGPCDAGTRIQTSGITATGAVGLMFHVQRLVDIGLHVRGPVNLHTTGTVTASLAPNAPRLLAQQMLEPSSASFDTQLPWVVRLGARYIFRSKRDGFEHGDVEVDGVYEAWHGAETPGDHVYIPMLGPFFHDINPTITHNYQDTFSVRLGGAWNARLPVGVFTLRLGGYYESAATKYADTRLDFDTFAKIAGTGGLGYRVRGIGLNIAYAYIFEPDRTVTNGDIHLINGIDGSFALNNQPTPVVNNGHYHAQTQIVSIGLTVAWEELLGRHRHVYWE
jgi:long-subunit fatty acid transport protein